MNFNHKVLLASAALAVLASLPALSFAHGDVAHGMEGKAQPMKVDRIIQITALNMSYDTPALEVRTGETIKFIVTNKSSLVHEFVLAGVKEQAEHEKMMQGMRDMIMADEANAIRIEPGKTKELVWKFEKAGVIEYACHQPGHYQGGMVGKITVKP
ncbi:MAG: plastocyanin/azurin family copper-binding protein [Gammaproteobacteria bacterium]